MEKPNTEASEVEGLTLAVRELVGLLREDTTGRRHLLLGVREVAELLGVSTRMVWSLVAAGKLSEPVELGGRTLWRRGEVETWVRRLLARDGRRRRNRRKDKALAAEEGRGSC